MSKEALSQMMNDCFHHLGIEAIYTSQSSGETIDVIVLRRTPDQAYDFGENVMVAASCEFEIRIDDIPRPLQGDLINADGMVYQVYGEPVRDGLHGFWKIQAIEHEG